MCVLLLFLITMPPPPGSTLFPYTSLFRSDQDYKEEREKRKQEDKGPRGPREPRGMAREARLVTRCYQCGHQEQRSEEHTSELQSLRHLVCRLLLEKKKK